MASPLDAQYNAIRQKITYYANKYGINPTIFMWQLWQENRFRSTGCSGAGACGIAQFIPATAARFNVNRSDIDSSLDGAARYMAWLLARSYINGNYSLALAGYNAGEGNVQKYKGIPPFTETRNYVATIMRNAGAAANTPVSNPVILPASTVPAILSSNNTVTPSQTQKDYAPYYILGALGLVLLLKV